MEERRKEKTRKRCHMCLLLLALFQIYTPSSAQNTANTSPASPPNPAALVYRTSPASITVAVGEPAWFHCGVPEAAPNFTFTLYGGHGNHSLICPAGHVKDIPEALYGNCEIKDGQSLAVWSIMGTSFSDNGTRVECQQLNNPTKRTAVLHVYDNGVSRAVIIGCAIGGFFGMLLVAGLVYLTLQRSETFQKCFIERNIEEDTTTIVTKY